MTKNLRTSNKFEVIPINFNGLQTRIEFGLDKEQVHRQLENGRCIDCGCKTSAFCDNCGSNICKSHVGEYEEIRHDCKRDGVLPVSLIHPPFRGVARKLKNIAGREVRDSGSARSEYLPRNRRRTGSSGSSVQSNVPGEPKAAKESYATDGENRRFRSDSDVSQSGEETCGRVREFDATSNSKSKYISRDAKNETVASDDLPDESEAKEAGKEEKFKSSIIQGVCLFWESATDCWILVDDGKGGIPKWKDTRHWIGLLPKNIGKSKSLKAASERIEKFCRGAFLMFPPFDSEGEDSQDEDDCGGGDDGDGGGAESRKILRYVRFDKRYAAEKRESVKDVTARVTRVDEREGEDIYSAQLVEEEEEEEEEEKRDGEKNRTHFPSEGVNRDWRARDGDSDRDRRPWNETEKKRTSLESAKRNSTGKFIVRHIEEDCLYGSFVPNNCVSAAKSFDKCQSLRCTDQDEIEAEIGDIVAVAHGDCNWHRGMVTFKSVDCYCVYLLDCGFTIRTDRVFELAEEFCNLTELAASIALKDPTSSTAADYKLNDPYELRLKEEVYRGGWSCVLESWVGGDRNLVAGTLSAPVAEKSNVINVKSGSVVQIAYVISAETVYIRLVDPFRESSLKAINNIISQHADRGAFHASQLFSMSVRPGFKVFAKRANDDAYYRGHVLRKAKDKLVVYLYDIGVTAEVDVEDIRPIPKHLRRIYPLTTKVKLTKDSFGFRMSFSCLERLRMKERELVVSYEDWSEGVTLTESGWCMIGRSRAEGSDGDDDDDAGAEDVDDESDLKSLVSVVDGDASLREKSCKLPEGRVHAFLVLGVNKGEFFRSGTFWGMNLLDPEVRGVVKGLHAKVQEHCKAVTEGYEPESGEACLAKYEGDWYRARVVTANPPKFEVFFVDFGHRKEVASDSIRKSIPEHFEQPTLAVKCVVHGFKDMGEEERVDAYRYIKSNVDAWITDVTTFAEDASRGRSASSAFAA